MIRILTGDVREKLAELADESVHCVVTSPPYWSLRDYGVAGQIGLEPTPDEYIATMVGVFREVRRVLRADGTLWLNMGDSYATRGGAVGRSPGGGEQGERFLRQGHINTQPNRMPLKGFKPKDLILMPARIALALQSDGWWLRSEIVWAKPNPMPESVTDRPTSAHEKVFLLSKSARYFYDSEAVREKTSGDWRGSEFDTGKTGVHQLDRSQSAASRKSKGGRYRGNAEENTQAVQPMRGDPAQGSLLPEKGRITRTCLQAVRQSAGDGLAGDESGTRKISGGKSFRSGGGEDQAIFCNTEGQGGNQTETGSSPSPGTKDHLDADSGGMAGNTGTPPNEVCVLSGRRLTVDAGSCNPDQQGGAPHDDEHCSSVQTLQQPEEGQVAGRNLRNVWNIATQPYPDAHFATFPTALVEPCIKAGTSEKGCCPECGAPWVREVEKERTFESGSGRAGNMPNGKNGPNLQGGGETLDIRRGPVVHSITTGWSPSCECLIFEDENEAAEWGANENGPQNPLPCTVLDPFAGSGTTGLVADRLGRHAILIELNPKYSTLAEKRIAQDGGMLTEIIMQ
jgi:DNA modification methylase